MRVLFASTNIGKFREVEAEALRFHFSVITPAMLLEEGSAEDVDKICAPMPVVEESMDTYLGNARLKAAAFNHWGRIPSLADDTGLEVAALGGRPGVHSARYAGAQGNAQRNIDKLLMELRNIKDRRAVFKCALSLYLNGTERLSVIEDLPGEIAENPSGCGGFGYDSIFYLPDYEMTLAQLKERHIEIETHRVRACKSLFTSLAAQPGIL